MISRKLHRLFLITVVLLAIHMAEEFFMSAYHELHIFDVVKGRFEDPLRGALLIAIILIGYTLLVLTLYTFGGKWELRAMAVFSFVYVLELSHLIPVLFMHIYEPGAVTAAFFPILGFLFIRELVRNFLHGYPGK